MNVITIGNIFIDITGDSKLIISTNKTLYELVKENELF